MTRDEMNLVNMFKATDWFLTANKELLKDYQPIVESHARLTAGLAIIDELSEIQSTDTKTLTKLKQKEKEQLDEKMIKVSDAIGAVAAATNNEELKQVADWPRSLLGRLREDNYYIKVQQIYKVAASMPAELKVWHVSTEDIEALNIIPATLKQRTPNRRNTVGTSKQASTELHQTVLTLNKELKEKTDKFMNPFATINPTLYGQYRNARTVLDIAATQKTKEKEDTKEDTSTDTKK